MKESLENYNEITENDSCGEYYVRKRSSKVPVAIRRRGFGSNVLTAERPGHPIVRNSFSL